MKIQELLNSTLPNFKYRVHEMHLVEGRITAEQPTRKVEGKIKNIVSGNTHICSVEGLSAGRLSTNHVKVACDCEYFLYICEYALNRKGAADIKYSNGKPPTTTNPTLIPTMCVHLVKFCKVVQQKKF